MMTLNQFVEQLLDDQEDILSWFNERAEELCRDDVEIPEKKEES